MVTKSEIIKEYVFTVDGVDYPIYGRVVKSDELEHLPFRWDISHYYRPTETAIGVYRPSRHHADSFGEAEQLLMAYADNFTSIDVTAATYY